MLARGHRSFFQYFSHSLLIPVAFDVTFSSYTPYCQTLVLRLLPYNMSFTLTELTSDSEFEQVIRCEFDAYGTPLNKLMQLFFPIKGSSPAALENAITDAIKRQRFWHRSDPTSRWILVKDVKSGDLAGAAAWHFYDANPYAAASDVDCDWWSSGTDRLVANSLMKQFLTTRKTYMRKAHACE